MVLFLGLEKKPNKLFQYQKQENRIKSLIDRMKMAPVYFGCVTAVCGLPIPIWYFSEGNYDPETWIILYDKFS